MPGGHLSSSTRRTTVWTSGVRSVVALQHRWNLRLHFGPGGHGGQGPECFIPGDVLLISVAVDLQNGAQVDHILLPRTKQTLFLDL